MLLAEESRIWIQRNKEVHRQTMGLQARKCVQRTKIMINEPVQSDTLGVGKQIFKDMR